MEQQRICLHRSVSLVVEIDRHSGDVREPRSKLPGGARLLALAPRGVDRQADDKADYSFISGQPAEIGFVGRGILTRVGCVRRGHADFEISQRNSNAYGAVIDTRNPALVDGSPHEIGLEHARRIQRTSVQPRFSNSLTSSRIDSSSCLLAISVASSVRTTTQSFNPKVTTR